MDVFDNVILCRECNKKMEKVKVAKDGFNMRALQCPHCQKKILHPADIEEYKKFSQLRNRNFHVKLRMVGNSYAISIPHEIINFFKETEDVHERMKRKMEKMVTLAFEEMGKISLMFNETDKEREKSKGSFIKEGALKK